MTRTPMNAPLSIQTMGKCTRVHILERVVAPLSISHILTRDFVIKYVICIQNEKGWG